MNQAKVSNFFFSHYQLYFCLKYKKQTIEAKKDEFRNYLEKTGVVDSLTRVLVSLYEENDKPPSALDFIKKNLVQTNDYDYDNLKKEYIDLKKDYDTLKKKYDELSKELEQYKS